MHEIFLLWQQANELHADCLDTHGGRMMFMVGIGGNMRFSTVQ